jgi:hypothetical protein
MAVEVILDDSGCFSAEKEGQVDSRARLDRGRCHAYGRVIAIPCTPLRCSLSTACGLIVFPEAPLHR